MEGGMGGVEDQGEREDVEMRGLLPPVGTVACDSDICGCRVVCSCVDVQFPIFYAVLRFGSVAPLWICGSEIVM